MGDIINLRRARKAKARTASEEKAAANRARFGRGKAESDLAAASRDLETRRLDAHQIAAPRLEGGPKTTLIDDE
jgi:hypothetical protein